MQNKISKRLYMSERAGFTLVELLLVIGIIATLAVVVFVALDPAKRFADSRDARRTSDAETILSAVHQYIIDNKGSAPALLPENVERTLGTGGAGCDNHTPECDSSVGECLDLSGELAKYLKTIPFDPKDGSVEDTKYTILKDNNGIITLKACSAEGMPITVSR